MISLEGTYRLEFHDDVLNFFKGKEIHVDYLTNLGNCYRYIIGIDSSNVYEFENLISRLEQNRSNQKSSNNIWKMIERLLSIIWFISCIGVFIIQAFTFSWVLYWIITKNNIFVDTSDVLLNWEERLFTNIN